MIRLNETKFDNYLLTKLIKKLMSMKSLSNILTLMCISFVTKVQRTEEYLLYENKLQKTSKSVMFLAGALISTAY
jgi:hypothetical protein